MRNFLMNLFCTKADRELDRLIAATHLSAERTINALMASFSAAA